MLVFAMDMSNKGKWEWFKFETKWLAIETRKIMVKLMLRRKN